VWLARVEAGGAECGNDDLCWGKKDEVVRSFLN